MESLFGGAWRVEGLGAGRGSRQDAARWGARKGRLHVPLADARRRSVCPSLLTLPCGCLSTGARAAA